MSTGEGFSAKLPVAFLGFLLYNMCIKTKSGGNTMTVLLVNGSPHEHGCTDTALKHTASVLEEQGVHTEIFWIGNKPISGCIGCGACKKGLGKC